MLLQNLAQARISQKNEYEFKKKTLKFFLKNNIKKHIKIYKKHTDHMTTLETSIGQ